MGADLTAHLHGWGAQVRSLLAAMPRADQEVDVRRRQVPGALEVHRGYCVSCVVLMWCRCAC